MLYMVGKLRQHMHCIVLLLLHITPMTSWHHDITPRTSRNHAHDIWHHTHEVLSHDITY